MREIRLSGSEGGAANVVPTPIMSGRRRLPVTQKRVTGMMVLERSPPGGGSHVRRAPPARPWERRRVMGAPASSPANSLSAEEIYRFRHNRYLGQYREEDSLYYDALYLYVECSPARTPAFPWQAGVSMAVTLQYAMPSVSWCQDDTRFIESCRIISNLFRISLKNLATFDAIIR